MLVFGMVAADGKEFELNVVETRNGDVRTKARPYIALVNGATNCWTIGPFHGDTATRVEKKIVVRAATDSSEFGICIGLQQAIWGYSDIDTVPDQMFVVAKKTGGQILLAFDGERAPDSLWRSSH